MFHCLFEQSGTFKNEFKKLGYEALDYDIQDEFGETDVVVDIFSEIDRAYQTQEHTLFDDIKKEDCVLAFFPCIRFENQIILSFRGQAKQQKNWSLEKKMEYDMQLLDELSYMYKLVNKMFIVCMRKGIRLIMENPFSEEHFLRRYWCLPPSIIDRDRRENGDYYKKPTQYWFLNCEPKNNLIFEAYTHNALGVKNAITNMKRESFSKMGAKTLKTARSMIHPDYANRFIREYILEEK